MANYTKATNFTAKDGLPTGNAGKIVKGSEIDTELTAIANAISSKTDSNSPTLTGTPTAPTASAGTNTTQLATTAFVTAANTFKADLVSPALTGTPTAPTASAGTSTTQLATTAFVTTADNLKANLASPALTGTPTAPTATAGTITTQIATTAFVATAIAGGTSGLGLGTMSTQNANNVAITGGSISGVALSSLTSPLATASGGVGTTSTTGTGSNVFSASPALTGTPTAPTASAGTNTTQLATTAFVTAERTNTTTLTNKTLTSPTINTPTISTPTITGGTITGITDLTVADGGTGSSTLAANAVLLGNGTSALQTVAPSTTGNLLTSNGTTWTSAAPTQIGIGSSQTWQDLTASRASGTTYTNSTGKPIQISIVIVATGSNQGNLVINGVTAVSSIVGAVNSTHQYSFIIPDTNTYVLTLSGGSVNRWLELR